MKASEATMRFMRRLPRLVLAPLLAAALLAAALQLGAATWLDGQIGEARFAAAKGAPSGEIVLVDIDAKSLAEVGLWPWPRRLHGKLVDAANRYGAASIAFDIDFSTKSNPEDDRLFAEALARSSAATFLAAFVQNGSADNSQLLLSQPIDAFANASWPALVNVTEQQDGIVREFPFGLGHGGERFASMPEILADVPEGTGSFGIDWGIDARQVPRISFIDVLEGQIEPDALRGKKLIVGATAIELHDLFSAPVYGLVSGSTVIATATETLLQNRSLTTFAPSPVAVVFLLIGLLVSMRRLPLRAALTGLLCLSLSVELGAYWLYVSVGVFASTAALHVTFGLVALALAVQELGVRRLMLWVARTELKNQETILTRVVEDGFDGVILLNERGEVLKVNRHAEELLSLSTIPSVSALPDQLIDLVRTVNGDPATRLDRLQHRDRTIVVEYSVSKVQTAEVPPEAVEGEHQGGTVTCIAIRDVTAREQAAEHLRFLAMNDSLTGLPNRRGLEIKLAELLADPAVQQELCLISFDLDRFKLVNDTLGHGTGDGVLREVGRRASEVLRGGFVARLGGDEFFAVVEDRHCEAAVEALRTAITEPMLVRGHTITVGVSFGIARAQPEVTAEDLIRHADLALYRAKAVGGFATFEPSMEGERLQRLALEKDLLRAFDEGQFRVAFQPQVRLDTGEVTGAEALLRWHHPEKGPISPALFIPVAEEMGLINRLGEWILGESCRLAALWEKPLKVAVNVSPLQFATDGLSDVVRRALSVNQFPPERLELEITESIFVQDSRIVSKAFEELLAIGVTFALDDFGTGYSSLSYLQRFPIAKVKIDQSFTREIGRSASSLAVFRAVRVLAAGLNIRTIAEGVETSEQARMLSELGCEEGQGYLYSKPISAGEFQNGWASRCAAPMAEVAA